MVAHLFDPGPDSIGAKPDEKISVTRRRTLRNAALLKRGIHPATRHPLLDPPGRTCGECGHHKIHSHTRIWHKCELHRLGMSSSNASDIRVSWPACALFEAQA